MPRSRSPYSGAPRRRGSGEMEDRIAERLYRRIAYEDVVRLVVDPRTCRSRVAKSTESRRPGCVEGWTRTAVPIKWKLRLRGERGRAITEGDPDPYSPYPPTMWAGRHLRKWGEKSVEGEGRERELKVMTLAPRSLFPLIRPGESTLNKRVREAPSMCRPNWPVFYTPKQKKSAEIYCPSPSHQTGTSSSPAPKKPTVGLAGPRFSIFPNTNLISATFSAAGSYTATY